MQHVKTGRKGMCHFDSSPFSSQSQDKKQVIKYLYT